MDASSLVAGAEGGSVTVDRLTDPVLDALDEGEQPHHLVRGKSCDVDAGADVERVYAAVDADAVAVATDDRLLFVVPQVAGARTTSLPYGDVDAASVTDESPHELRVEADGTEYRFNVGAGEEPGPIGAFVRDRLAAARAPSTDGSGPGDAGPLGDGPADSGTVDPGTVDSGTVDYGTVDSVDAPATDGAGAGIGERDGGGVGDGDGAGTAGSAGGPTAGDDAETFTRGGGRSGGASDPGRDAGPGPDADGGDGGPDGDGESDDPLDTLERLSELHEKGVLDDEEFQRKKTELLDQL